MLADFLGFELLRILVGRTQHSPFPAEGRRRVRTFRYFLSYSRRNYQRFLEFQDLMATTREHVRAFSVKAPR